MFRTLWSDWNEENVCDKKETVSHFHRENMNHILATLKTTNTKFVRCLLPNLNKKMAQVDGGLLLSQLRSNGIMQGARICRIGYPDRISFADFRQRFEIINKTALPDKLTDNKKATEILLRTFKIDHNQYKLGQNMVFLRSGFINVLDDLRDSKISSIIARMQNVCKGKLQRKKFASAKAAREAAETIQTNWRSYDKNSSWPWLKLIHKLKPLLTHTDVQKQINQLEVEIANTQADLETERKRRLDCEGHMTTINDERNALAIELQCEVLATNQLEEKCQALLEAKVELTGKMKLMTEQIEDGEELNITLRNKSMALDQEVMNLKQDIHDIEVTIAKVEKDRHASENKGKNLQEEMGGLEEVIEKLQKEKKNLQDSHQTSLDDLQAEGDKTSSLIRLKTKLENQLDEVENNLDAEKKIRLDIERSKRQSESNYRLANDAISDLNNDKNQLEEEISKIKHENYQLNLKLTDETSNTTQLQKKLKERQARIDEIEDGLEFEKGQKSTIEKQRNDLRAELEELNQKLEDAGGATAAQVELNRRREAEMVRLRRDMEEANLAHEYQSSQWRKKHLDATSDLSEQIDNLMRAKQNNEKEKSQLKMELQDVEHALQTVTKAKIDFEKLCTIQEDQLHEAKAKATEFTREINELNAVKDRLKTDNVEQLRNIEEKEQLVKQLTRTKNSQAQQVEILTTSLGEEEKAKQALAQGLQNSKREMEYFREQSEAETGAKLELQRTLSFANAEVAQWRTKYETDAIQRTEELEEAKKRLAEKLIQSEEDGEASRAKNTQLEKVKARLSNELDDIHRELGAKSDELKALEKKQRNIERSNTEWQQKADEAQTAVESSQKEARSLSTELFKTKNAYEECLDALDVIKRENKNLQEEITDMSDSLGESTKKISDNDRERRSLEQDRNELQSALEDAESAVEGEEAKVLRMQVELVQQKNEYENRISEKETEVDDLKKNATRAVESLQTTLDSEIRGRSEALRQKKKAESVLDDCENQLVAANSQCVELKHILSEANTNLNRSKADIKQMDQTIDDLKDQVAIGERTVQLVQSECEEMKHGLEQADRGRKLAEAELQESIERTNLLHTQNTALVNSKRKAEQSVTHLQADVEEKHEDLSRAEDKAKKAIKDAAMMAEELKKEQNQSVHMERYRKNMEVTVKDLNQRLTEAEEAAMKGGKVQIQKLDQRVRELENELDMEQGKTSEAVKNQKKLERKIKEIVYTAEQDKKNLFRLQDLVDKLQVKVKSYKKQAENNEEAANTNLQRYRKLQHALNEAEDRASSAQKAIDAGKKTSK